MLPSGLVEVNGQVPTSSAMESKLKSMWGTYGKDVVVACRNNSVPVAWFMGIMLQESGGNPGACSPCNERDCPSLYRTGACATQKCCAYGLMQFIDSTARMYGATGPQLMGNSKLAIEVASRLIADLGKKHNWDLVRIAASYNCGSPKCTGEGTFGLCGQHDYMMKVATAANTFQGMNLNGDAIIATMGAAVWIGVLLGGYLAWRKNSIERGVKVPL
jgi:hypothetical protein